MSETKIGKTMESLAKGLDNFSKLIVANKQAASGEVAEEAASTGNVDPSGVNQDYKPKKVNPENIGYSSQNTASSSSTTEDSDMLPVIEGSDIVQAEKAIKHEGKSLDKIISKLEDDSGISKSKKHCEKLEKDEESEPDTSDSDSSDEDSDIDSDIDIDEDGEDINIRDKDGEVTEEETEKAVYMEVNDLVKGVLSETGLEKKINRIEKSLADHEKGFKHLAKAIVQIAKALRSVKNESTLPIRKSVPSVSASVNRLSKAVIADKLFNLAKEGKISSTEVVKFETTGTLSEDSKRELKI